MARNVSEKEGGLPDAEAVRAAARRRRSIALALILGGVVLLFYVLTVFKLGPGIFNRDL
jgi:hypothetical protein